MKLIHIVQSVGKIKGCLIITECTEWNTSKHSQVLSWHDLSQWPHGLAHRSVAAHLLGRWLSNTANGRNVCLLCAIR